MRIDARSLFAVAMLAALPSVAVADCQCLANGRRYHHGAVACLTLPTGNQLAQCDMVLNNSAWKKIRDGCPEASAAPVSPVDEEAKVRPPRDSGRSKTHESPSAPAAALPALPGPQRYRSAG